MATKIVCYPSVRARAARFTKVDDCGCPKPGLCNIIVTNDVVTLNATAEIEEGEEITVRNFAGQLCISDKPCDALKWYNIELTLCKQIPALFALTSNIQTAHDANGQVVGYGIASNIDCSGGFAVELWGDVPGQACTPGLIGGQFDYLIFPWVSAATPTGDIEIGNSARQPVLKGRTKTGGCWGAGPYGVQNTAVTGDPVVPGPLIDPIPPEMHLWDLLVNIPPPKPACECEDLTIFCTAQLDTDDPTGRTVRLRWGALGGTVSIDWGDGSTDSTGGQSGDLLHEYLDTATPPPPATYLITVTNTDGATTRVCTALFSTAPQTVPEGDPDGGIIEVTADATGRTAGVRVDNRLGLTDPGTARPVIIDWGDGSPKVEVTGTPATAPAFDATHAYAVPGNYVITFCDKGAPSRCSHQNVTIPFP